MLVEKNGKTHYHMAFFINVGKKARVYYTLSIFMRGGGGGPRLPAPLNLPPRLVAFIFLWKIPLNPFAMRHPVFGMYMYYYSTEYFLQNYILYFIKYTYIIVLICFVIYLSHYPQYLKKTYYLQRV